MSQKNFASYGDMETLVAEIADKCGPYTEISYEDWLQLTPYQQEHGRWDVTGVPGADGTISIDLMTKLWENTDPASSFAEQNIKLSSDDYDMLLWVFRVSSYTLRCCSEITMKGNGTTLSIAEHSSNAASNRTRVISRLTDTFFNVGVGRINGVENNDLIIPYKAYGIKLHHTVEIKAIAPTVSTSASKCMMSDGETSVEDIVTGVFTPTENVTVLHSKVRKQLNIVSLDILLQKDLTANQWNYVGDIPANFAPDTYVMYCQVLNDTDVGIFEARILRTKIHVYPTVSGTKNFTLVTTYITTN